MAPQITNIPLLALSHKAGVPHHRSAHSSTQSLLGYSNGASDSHYGVQDHKPWTPFMLRRSTLLVLSSTCVLLIGGLEIVSRVSNDRHGFGPVDTNLHYIWTYGPTAIFAIIAAFWTQVDYRSRQAQPWAELAKGPQEASRNVLLDYISPDPASAFVTSLRYHHWPVSVVLVGSLLFKTLIVVSTGLFAPRFDTIPVTVPIKMLERFQGNGLNVSNIDNTAASIYTSILFSQLSYPSGTDAEYAVEMFRPSEEPDVNSYNVSSWVDTFAADLDCQRATMESKVDLVCPRGSSCRIDYMTMTAENDNCRIPAFPSGNRTLTVTSATEANMGPQDKFDYGAWYGGFFIEKCEGQPADSRRIVIFSLYKKPGPMLINSTTLFCKPVLRFQRSNVTMDEVGTVVHIDQSTTAPAPVDIDAYDVSSAVQASLDRIQSIESIGPCGNNTRKFQFGSFISLVLLSQGCKQIEDGSDFELLLRGAKQVYRGLASQLAKQYLLVSASNASSHSEQGRLSYGHQRLTMQELSLRVTEVALCMIVLLSAYLALRPIKTQISQDTASLGRLASAISQSKQIIEPLAKSGDWPVRDLKEVFKSTYVSGLERSFQADGSVFLLKGDVAVCLPTREREHFWQPFMVTWYVRIALLAIPLGFIAALEILYQKSSQNSGLFNVTQAKQTQLGASIVPALSMALLKLLFSSFDFNLRILDPFIQLKGRSVKATPSILNKTIYTWRTDALWEAFKHQRYAVGASTLSVMIASFLTVAVSGLYVTAPVTRGIPVSLHQIDAFPDTTPPFSIYNESIARTTRLIVYGKMQSSKWTRKEYALPGVSLDDESVNISSISSINVDLPARRGILNCTLLPQEYIIPNYSLFEDRSDLGVYLQWSGIKNNCTLISYNDEGIYLLSGMTDGPFGRWNSYRNKPSGCPTSVAVYGVWRGKIATDLNVVQCFSAIQEIQVSASFDLPSWTFQSMLKHEDTTKTILAGQNLTFNLDTYFPSSISRLNSTFLVQPSFDGPFSVFLRTPNSYDLDMDLLQRDKFEALNARMQSAYGLVVAQTLSNVQRNTTLAAGLPLLKATAFGPTLRFQQSEISTRILQGLLVAMVLCALVPVFSLRLSKVLPKNPCSIAAQASLVAGSKMLARLPPGAQRMSDKEFATLMERDRYTLGWTIDEHGERRFGIDIDDRVREVRE